MNDEMLTREVLLQEIDESWDKLMSFVDSLTEAQLTQPTDPAGWTVKDHLIHLAVWEKAALGLLDGKTKRDVLDIAPEVWEQGDDPINAVLQERYQDMPLDEVLKTLRDQHETTVQRLTAMTEADLQLPYRHYQPNSTEERPIILWMDGDTSLHYLEHIPWMAKIAEQA